MIAHRTLDGATAEAEGWFRGPPYGVAEIVFDEDDLDGCEPVGNPLRAAATAGKAAFSEA